MEKKFLKTLGSLLVIIFFLIGLTVKSQDSRQNLEVDFLDVGQGDAILIKTPYDQNILIDGGPNNQVLTELGNNLAFFDKNLDLVVLTHPHSDHVAGLVEVLRRYQVKKVLMTGVVHTAPDYLAFLEEIKKQNLETQIVQGPQDIIFGQDLTLKILYPLSDLSGKKVEDLNNSSIVAKLVYKNSTLLLTGDADDLAEQELLSAKADLKSEVLKVSHHGSKYSSSLEFLDQVKPTLGIITVGQNNDFGHPHLRTIKNLEQQNIKILRTDQLGAIGLLSDGISWRVK